MVMRALDRRLLRMMSRSRLQCLAIITVIALGLLAFVVLNNTFENLDGATRDYYEQQGFAHLFADLAPQPPDYVEGLDELPEIRSAEGRIVADMQVDVGRDAYPELHLVALPSDGEMNRPFVLEGDLPGEKSRNEVALFTGFAAAHDLQVGDELDLIARGEAVTVRVSGLVDSPEFLYPITDLENIFAPDEEHYGIGFADLDFAADILGMPGQVNDATFEVAPGYCFEAAEDAVEEEMEGRGLRRIITRDDQLSHYSVSLRFEQLEELAATVPVVFLGIAAVIIYMLLMRMVEADRTVIGVLKAMGYSDYHILLHYLKYALVLGAVGAVLGMGVGHLLIRPITEMVFLEFFAIPLLRMQINWSLIIVGSFLTLLFCGGTGMWAARGVLRIVPAHAMQPAAPPPGGKNLLETYLPRVWGWLSFSYRIMLRQLFRNKKRFILAVLGVAFAYTLVLFPFYMLGMVDSIIYEPFERFEIYDYSVSFDEPVSDSGIAGLAEQIDVRAMEPVIEHPFEVSSGWRDMTVLLLALPHDAQLRRFENERGQRIQVPDSGVLICEYMSRTLQVSTGDEVVLSSHVTGEREHAVPIKGVIRQDFGTGAYMSLASMHRLTGGGDAYTGAFLQSDDDVRYGLREAGNVASISSVEQMIEGFDELMGLLVGMCLVLVAVGGVFAFAILFNIATVGIMERAREFSAMRVLGYGRSSIFRIILHENILATVLGLLLGAPMGHATFLAVLEAFQRTEMIFLPMPFSPVSHLMSGAVVCCFVALVMGAVWVKVRNIDLLESLSSRMT